MRCINSHLHLHFEHLLITIENGLMQLKTVTCQRAKRVYWCVVDKISCWMTRLWVKFTIFISPGSVETKVRWCGNWMCHLSQHPSEINLPNLLKSDMFDQVIVGTSRASEGVVFWSTVYSFIYRSLPALMGSPFVVACRLFLYSFLNRCYVMW